MASGVSTPQHLTFSSFSWINELEDGKQLNQDGDVLHVRCLPGSIWGSFGRANPAHNTGFLSSVDLSSSAVKLQMQLSLTPGCFGEQAGICILFGPKDDLTARWIKLVVEGMKSGPPAVVFAQQAETDLPYVISKCPLDPHELALSTLSLHISSEQTCVVLLSFFLSFSHSNFSHFFISKVFRNKVGF